MKNGVNDSLYIIKDKYDEILSKQIYGYFLSGGNYLWNLYFAGYNPDPFGPCVGAWATTRNEEHVWGLRPVVRLKTNVELVPNEDGTIYNLR